MNTANQQPPASTPAPIVAGGVSVTPVLPQHQPPGDAGTQGAGSDGDRIAAALAALGQQPPAQQPPAQQPPAQQDTGQQPHAGDARSAGSIDQMSDAQLDDLAQRIQAARQNRPQSLAAALETLGKTLTEQHRAKESAVEQRREGSQQADAAQQAIAEVRNMVRRAELVEAATAARFKNPSGVAAALLHVDGDPAKLIADAAAAGTFAMAEPPATTPDLSQRNAGGSQIDPGLQAIVDEINRAYGRR